MSRPNPIADGFRAVLRLPSLLLAELAWRWSFGIAATVLVVIGMRELQHAVVLTPMDELLLASMQPMLMAEAWAHILQQVWPLMWRLTAILFPALSLMWIAAATLGRTVTIRRLLEHFAPDHAEQVPFPATPWGAMTMLHFLRAVVMLAVFLGYIGAAVIASYCVINKEGAPPNLDVAWVVFVLVFALIVIVAAAINWVLSLAPIFVIGDGLGTWESLGAAIQLFRARGSQLTAAATLNGVARFGGACVATFAGLFPLALVGEVPGWVVWGLLAIITAVYCLVSDWLLLARLASYISVVEQPASSSELQPSSQ